MNANFLLDSYEMSGTGRKSLLDAAAVFAANTTVEMIDPKELEIYSLLTNPGGRDYISCIRITPGEAIPRILVPKDFGHVHFQAKNKNVMALSFKSLESHGMTRELIHELTGIGFFFMYKGKICLASRDSLAMFSKQIGIGKPPLGINPFRDIYLASVMRGADPFMTVTRSCVNGSIRITKMVGAFTPDYMTESHEILLDMRRLVSKKFGKAEIGEWKVGHERSYADYVLGSKTIKGTYVEEGIRFSFSDVGSCAYKLQAYIKVGKGISYVGEGVSQKHTPNFKPEELVSSLDIGPLSNWEEILASMYVPVDDRNRIVRTLIRETGVTSAMGKKTMDRVKRCYLSGEPPKNQTFLDSALMFMRISELTDDEIMDYAKEKIFFSTGKIFDVYEPILSREIEKRKGAAE